MRHRLSNRGDSDERGAIAILTALLTVVVLVVAALAVDISTQVNERQKLHDTIDAAAHAGAYRLPGSGTQARTDALAYAASNDPAAPTPTVHLFCVVASLNGSVDTSQIPPTCDPLVEKANNYPNARCNSKICAIPCDGANDVCNTVEVTGDKPVPFSFAPVIGINQGSTGSVTSVACKGSCGTVPINPMDVVVVADRTTSMKNSGSIPALVAGIEGMLTWMTPSQQYVALGTIGRSKSNPGSPSCTGSAKAWSEPGPETGGPWIPVPFSNNYLVTGTKTLNTSDVTGTRSNLVQAVECLKNNSSSGTYLASPMKAAARYLLGPSSPYDASSNINSLPARTGTIQKAIIFETDGAPQESNMGGSAALSDSADIGSTNGTTACTNLSNVASSAKAIPNNILVVTVAFDVSTDKCDGSSGPKIADVLAAASSPTTSGANTAGNYNNNDCSTSPGRILENGDGDNFFCAAPGENLAPIFATAFKQLAKGIRLIQLP